MLHPLNLSTTLYVVQRMTQLMTLFSLASLWSYCAGREALPLDENLLAGRTSVAFMTPVSKLAPGQAAAVYLIQSNGGQ